MKTYVGLGRDYVDRHVKKTGNKLYLHLKRDCYEVEDPKGDGPERKVTRLAIGMEGGFDPDSKTIEKVETYSVVIWPNHSVLWPSDNIPPPVNQVVQAILDADSALKKAEVEALSGTWDGEARAISKHAAELVQLDNNVKVPPSGWKCEKCQLDSNLWLNLTDGSILCGRKFYDGSGGNEHALQHYKETAYPLAVKLGTITKEGKGDVYSYDEDDMVEDPYLIQHLAHFGINIQNLEKTEKSMAELELDLNQRFGEWSTLQEAGTQLKPCHGPGLTGLANMGNSCYLNSVVQVIFTIPHFIDRYYTNASEIFSNARQDPAEDFNVQMAKLATGLLSGKYSRPPPPENNERRKIIPTIAPAMFKNLIGRGHPVFSTKHQQDAQEFFLHLITTVQRNSRGHVDPTECFKLKVEDRFQCGSTGKVKYMYRTEYCLPLPIPLSAAINKAELAAYEAKKASSEKLEPGEVVRPKIHLLSCLECFSQVETVEQFYSSAINDKTTARKTTRLVSFPDFLVIHLKKFMLREDWVPIKLDVSVEMPDELELGGLKGTGGLQPGEQPLPELDKAPPQPPLDQSIIGKLVEMGFPLEASKKATYFTDSKGLEQATAWAMEHVADTDFSDPFVPPGTETAPKKDTAFVPKEDALEMIMAMGFGRDQAIRALKATDNNVERAADWIFSHAVELDQPEESEAEDKSSTSCQEMDPNQSTKYQLVAFISHMGSSSSVGHYVCHILHEGRWVIFNDEKVALSENPPKDLGYLYLYRRL
ncbi:hypothetical protein AAG570_009620 [Ranatra chinensis]|uniref:Ubiquitin carboxyl-terminal hydrolase n=1 Tax=Ranatra chinensis TaxID=642074 RepID=A0ABD0YPL1_9HEMI